MPSKYKDLSLTLYNIVSSNGSVETARSLMQAGASSSFYTDAKTKQTALHKAVALNNLLMVSMLLSFDCDLSALDKSKYTPIVTAAMKKFWPIVEEIAKRKSASYSYHYGHALLRAVKDNQYGTAEILLQAGAATTWHDVATLNTIYHYAVINNNPNMIILLRFYENDFSKLNREGKTPLNLATTLNYGKCIQAFTVPLPSLNLRNLWKLYVPSALLNNHHSIKKLAFSYNQNNENGRALLFTTLLAISDESSANEKIICKKALDVPVDNWKFWSFSGTECLRKFLKYCLAKNIFQSVKEKYNIANPIEMFLFALVEVSSQKNNSFFNPKTLTLTMSRLKQSICSTYVDSGKTRLEAETLFEKQATRAAKLVAQKRQVQVQREEQPGSEGERLTINF